MKTVEKENYDRLWQPFTERLEEGKNVTEAYPASTKQGKEQNHSLLSTKKKNRVKESFHNCDNTYVPAASNPRVEANSSLVLLTHPQDGGEDLTTDHLPSSWGVPRIMGWWVQFINLVYVSFIILDDT